MSLRVRPARVRMGVSKWGAAVIVFETWAIEAAGEVESAGFPLAEEDPLCGPDAET